jgi:hypothetical protein
MRAEKAKKFKELQTKKGTPDYEEWFLNYKPEVAKGKMESNMSNTNEKRENKHKTKTKKFKKTQVKKTRRKSTLPFYKR